MSWFTDLFRHAQGVVRGRAQDFVVAPLGAAQGAAERQVPVRPDLDYVSVRLMSARIVDVRRWTGTFYACVHCRSSWLDEARGTVEYQTVVAPAMLRELNPAHLDRVVMIDKPLLGPVPFRGRLALEVGLFSVKGGELAGPYVDLLTSLADTAGVSHLKAALPFVEPLRKGADLLFGNRDAAELEAGLDQEFGEPRTGLYLVMRAPKAEVDVGGLRLDGDYRLLDAAGRPFGDHPYLVFAVRASDRREDWMRIPELNEAWEAARRAVRERRVEEARALLEQFALLCQTSPDLVLDDAQRLAASARQRFGVAAAPAPASALERAGGAEAGDDPLGPLESLGLYRAPGPGRG